MYRARIKNRNGEHCHNRIEMDNILGSTLSQKLFRKKEGINAREVKLCNSLEVNNIHGRSSNCHFYTCFKASTFFKDIRYSGTQTRDDKSSFPIVPSLAE